MRFWGQAHECTKQGVWDSLELMMQLRSCDNCVKSSHGEMS